MNAYCNGWVVLLCLPWFFFEQARVSPPPEPSPRSSKCRDLTRCLQKRPALVLPPGANMWNVGFINLWQASKKIWQLKQTLLYLVAYVCCL